jgi:ATP-dependent Lon protease
VQGTLDRSRGRSPELEAFYERMLETSAERFLPPSSIDALAPLLEECPNFNEVLDDLARYLRLAHAGDSRRQPAPRSPIRWPLSISGWSRRRLAPSATSSSMSISMRRRSSGW